MWIASSPSPGKTTSYLQIRSVLAVQRRWSTWASVIWRAGTCGACLVGSCRKSPARKPTHRTPLILLFDEPTSNLDPESIEDFAALLRRLKEQGKTLVIAEHRVYFLAGIVDRVILVEDGRIAQEFTGENSSNLMTLAAATWGFAA